jgi:D-alanyl-D-alanine carboxypeptidase (penicillin-binding protein 5/6)
MDFGSGQTLAEGHADQRIEPASLTKLMSAYVVFSALRAGQLKMDEQVLISEHAWRAEGSRTFVKVGTRVPVDVLIKGMIVQSGNDATIALAERVGGSEPAFVQVMNSDAQRLGMHGTHFEDASGLPSPTHYSTARDLATLSRAIIRDFPEYYGLYSLREFTWNNIRQENRNGLLGGIKRRRHQDGPHGDRRLLPDQFREASGMRLISVVLGARGVVARDRQRRAPELWLQHLRDGQCPQSRRSGAQAARVQGHGAVRGAGDPPRRRGHRAAWPGHHGDDAHAAAPAAHRTAPGRHRGR